MELETKVIENEQRSKSNVHRQDKLVTAVCGLQKDVEHTKTDVGEIKANLEKVLEKPGKRWDGVVTAVVTALISVLVGALLGRLI